MSSTLASGACWTKSQDERKEAERGNDCSATKKKQKRRGCFVVSYFFFLLVRGRVPGDGDHQVDGELDGDDVGHHALVAPQRPQQALAGAGYQTCNIKKNKNLLIKNEP